MGELENRIEECLATKRCFQYATDNKTYCLLSHDDAPVNVKCPFYSIGSRLSYKIFTEIFYYDECKRDREEFIKKIRRGRNGNLAEDKKLV